MRIQLAHAIAMAIATSLSNPAAAEGPLAENSSTAVAGSSVSQNISIPAGDLTEALKSFAKQTASDLVYRPEQVQGLRTEGVSGNLRIREALDQLLKGTKLRANTDSSTGAILIAAPLAAATNQTTHAVTSLNLWARLENSRDSESADSSFKQDDGKEKSHESSYMDERLEEVVVTAQKRKENIQDVPVTITAISGQELKARGAVDIKDVLGSIPGLSVSNAVERGLSKYTIRGVASLGGDRNIPTTGIYLDDISLLDTETTFQGAFDAVLFDLERVEVLKGPQGTLFGGSAMGGAIRYVSARPNLSKSSLEVATGIATTAHGSLSYKGEGVFNLPLIPEVLAVRGGVYFNREGGFIDNVAGGTIEDTAWSSTPYPVYTPVILDSLSTLTQNDQNESDSVVGRLSLLWQPDPSLSIRPAIVYQDYKLDGTAEFHTHTGLPELTSTYRLRQPTHDRAGIYSLDIVKDFGAVEVTSLTAYLTRDTEWTRDYSFFISGLISGFTPFPLDGLARYSTENKTVSQELRIASSPNASSPLKWLAGLYYRNYENDFPSTAYLYGSGFGAFFGLPDDVAYITDTLSKAREYAAFGEVTYSLSDSLDLTAGLRWFEIDQQLHAVANGVFNGGPSEGRGKESTTGVIPKAGLRYRIDADHMVFASAAKGTRPGSVFIPGGNYLPDCQEDFIHLGYPDGAPGPLEPDSLWTYELGSKNEIGGRATVNGSVYFTDWKDIQQSLGLPNCGGAFSVNAGAAEILGVEVEARIDLTEHFQFGSTLNYSDAKITEPPAAGNTARKGDEILGVPEWVASAYASYSLPVSSTWDLDLRTDYSYRGRQRINFVRTQLVHFPGGVDGEWFWPQYQEGYDTLSAFAALDNGSTNVRLYIHNAFDERPILEGFAGLGFGSSRASTIRPRTIGVEVRHEF